MNEIHLFLFSMGKNVCKSNRCSVERVLKICLSFFSYKENKGDGKVACNKCGFISEPQ